MSVPILARRTILGAAAVGAVLAPLVRPAAGASRIEAIAFDGFPIFDPRSIAAATQQLFPENGERLAAAWAQKLFDYSWIETAASRYSNFEALAHASLRFAADSMGIGLTGARSSELVGHYSQLDVWPDVKPALVRLRNANIRLVLLSNMTEAMLWSNMKRSGIDIFFEPPLSTDKVRRYKPAPAAYQMAVDHLGLPKASIGFAAFGGWDAFGAAAFGYRTAWVNRFRMPVERLDPMPAITGDGIEAVLRLADLT